MKTRNPRGEQRRAAILARLRTEGPAYHAELARAVGLATHRSFSPALDGHLTLLEAEGSVRATVERRESWPHTEGLLWEASA